MKILLTSIGTRGDVEPFLAIGERLADRGHEIVFSFPEQYKNIISKGFTFHALSPRMIELIESKEGRIVMGKAKWLAKFRAIIHLYKEGKKVNKVLMKQQYEIVRKEKPDLIIHNVKCNYPFLWGMEFNKKTVLLSPVPYFIYYAKGHAHIGFNKNFGAFINKLSYRLANFGLVKTLYDAQIHLQEGKVFSKSAIREAIFDKKLIYTISPTLFQRPNDWGDNVQVLGYHERNKIGDWKPAKELIRFIEKQPKVVFITFGSMVNSCPEEISAMIYKVIDELGMAAIVNTAAGGLLKMQAFGVKENFYFTEQIPYDWILSRVSAIVHHGGSGTTHLGLKYGCPTLIIPHIMDQYGWNNLIHEIGAGPKGVSINKLEASNFKESLSALLTSDSYKRKTKKIATSMAKEMLGDKLYDFILED